MQVEIFKTKTASIAQKRGSDAFILTFEEEEIAFKLCDLYTLRKKISELDIVHLFDIDSPDFELIHLPHCDRFLLLSIHDILQFRELLNGTFNILALNSAIHKILRKNVFNF